MSILFVIGFFSNKKSEEWLQKIKIGGLPLYLHAISICMKLNVSNDFYIFSNLKLSEDILKNSNIKLKKSINLENIKKIKRGQYILNNINTKNGCPEFIVYINSKFPFLESDNIKNIINSAIRNNDKSITSSAIKCENNIWKKELINNSIEPISKEESKDFVVELNDINVYNTKLINNNNNKFVENIKLLDYNNNFKIENYNEVNTLNSFRFNNSILFKYFFKTNCKALVMDFDGVHTNDSFFLENDGSEHIIVSRSDGIGLGILKENGFKLLILTREENNIVNARANKLKIDIFCGVNNKIEILKKWALNNNLNKTQVAYVGNDINDIECLNWVGFPFAPSDANRIVASTGCHVLSSRGGEGVIREIAQFLN